MQAAADAAGVGSISESSAGYLAATKRTSDGLVSAGVSDANNLLNENLSATGGYANLSVISTVIKIGRTHRPIWSPGGTVCSISRIVC